MAESVVSQVATRLAGLLSQEFFLLYGVREEVAWMERELRCIKCFLKDADAKGRRDEKVQNWLNDVIQVAYQAENAIDTFLSKVNHPSRGGLSFLNSLNPNEWTAKRQVSVEIGKVRERLNEIKTRREAYGIQNLDEDGEQRRQAIFLPVRRPPFLSHSFNVADVVGLSNDQRILLQRLMNHQQQQQQRLCVISIVGIGGLGKTTLARKLYENHAVSIYFPKRIWVTVSQENSLMGLLRKLLEEVTVIEKEKLEKMTENDLMGMINESLRTQRFLLVLDDIWREDIWIQMERILLNVNNGSSVLITTRFLNVAKRGDPTSDPYQLPLLNDDESMKLLLKKAFPREDAEANCSSELRDIGLRLARKCGGLPLALVVLGGLLSKKEKTPAAWWKVLETMEWEEEGRDCQEILALSYEDLPYDMKSCFRYLVAYPEDYDIPGKELIRKWIAEGFIPEKEKKNMEDTAEAILDELIQRSLIHVNTRKNNGSVKTCGVHDLLLDFARSAVKKDGFFTVCSIQPTFSTSSSHRVAIHNTSDTLINEIHTMHGLRTLMVFAPLDDPIVSPIFKFQSLRVLDLVGLASVKTIPKALKLMIHLRYFRLRGATVSGIPSSIGNLGHLETIDLPKEKEVPITLWKIKTLRHVQVRRCNPPQSLELRNLLTLDSVTFGSHKTINWRFPNLRKLKVAIYEEQHGAMLTYLLLQLDHLISLCIKAEQERPIEINTKDFPFHNRLLSLTLNGFFPKGDNISEFPTCLTKLELCFSGLEKDPMPKLERLQYLVTLKLSENVYLGKTMVCSTGGFPRLKSLFITTAGGQIEALPNLEDWIVQRDAMPKLTFLLLTSCQKLKRFPDLAYVSSLRELELGNMPEEFLHRLESGIGRALYKIQHVRKLTLRKHSAN